MVKYLADVFVNRHSVFIVLRSQQVYLVAGSLKLVGDYIVHLGSGNRKGDQCRWNVDVLEGAGHRVLTADGGGAELKLRVQRTEERGKRLAPAHGLIAELFKKFL